MEQDWKNLKKQHKRDKDLKKSQKGNQVANINTANWSKMTLSQITKQSCGIPSRKKPATNVTWPKITTFNMCHPIPSSKVSAQMKLGQK